MASMGPGPLGPGKGSGVLVPGLRFSLQWGRALSDPEREMTESKLDEIVEALQWGRALSDPESGHEL